MKELSRQVGVWQGFFFGFYKNRQAIVMMGELN
jgi:hypothetical protein